MFTFCSLCCEQLATRYAVYSDGVYTVDIHFCRWCHPPPIYNGEYQLLQFKSGPFKIDLRNLFHVG